MIEAMALAHQGGWDEILFVLAPLLVFAGLLVVARRRVGDMDTDGEPAADSEPETSERHRP